MEITGPTPHGGLSASASGCITIGADHAFVSLYEVIVCSCHSNLWCRLTLCLLLHDAISVYTKPSLAVIASVFLFLDNQIPFSHCVAYTLIVGISALIALISQTLDTCISAVVHQSTPWVDTLRSRPT